MRNGAFPEYIAVGKVGLDQGDFFDAKSTRLILVKRAAQGLES
jgi:hypothetical protein